MSDEICFFKHEKWVETIFGSQNKQIYINIYKKGNIWFLRMSFQVFIFCVEIQWQNKKSSDEGSTSQETINFLFSNISHDKRKVLFWYTKLLQLHESHPIFIVGYFSYNFDSIFWKVDSRVDLLFCYFFTIMLLSLLLLLLLAFS